MFKNLPASTGRKHSKKSTGAVLASLVVHGLLLAGAVYASANAGAIAEKIEEEVTFLDLTEEPPPPPEPVEPPPVEEPPPPPEPEQPIAEPIAKGTQALTPPKDPPKVLPDVRPDEVAVDPRDFSGQGTVGGIADGVKGGKKTTLTKEAPKNMGGKGEPVDFSVLEERPEVTNSSEVGRLLSRNYPPLLRDAGITGQAVLKFVIGTNGRVEPGSVSIVSSTHDQFGDAAIKVAERLRFKPMRIDGRPVRVAATFPISFTVDS